MTCHLLQDSELHFMMPNASVLTKLLEQNGIDEDSHVVLYDNGENKWACRVWWMLKAMGFDNISVLNGGLKKWIAEAHPVAHEISSTINQTRTSKTTSISPSSFVTKGDVLASLNNSSIKRVCALETEMFEMAHIPDSINIPLSGLFNMHISTIRPIAELQEIFKRHALEQEDNILAYCGGGIAASCKAFALYIAGYTNVCVYDGSMEEWTQDPTLPIIS